MNKLIAMLCLLVSSAAYAPLASADTFLNGPGRIGEAREVSGRVIGFQSYPEQSCYLLLADIPGRKGGEGMGGGGRFFLCDRSDFLSLHQQWSGAVHQTGTRRARIGPRWRVVPVFERAG